MSIATRVEPVRYGRAAVAGIVAALTVTVFESLLKRTPLNSGTLSEEPPTEALANRISETLTGNELQGFERQAAGLAVHCATGAALGVAYSQYRRSSSLRTEAAGALFGLGVWAILEEASLSIAGLKPPPWRTKFSSNALTAASHLVFGLTLASLYEHETRKRPSISVTQNPAAL